MRLQPRHYFLIAIILGLGIWNLWHRSHVRQTGGVVTIHDGPQTPAWQAFDHAASLRDAPDPQFTPALEDLRNQANGDSGADAADLRNCLMWLQYYRRSVPTASGNAGNWGILATSHVHTCMTQHRDVGR